MGLKLPVIGQVRRGCMALPFCEECGSVIDKDERGHLYMCSRFKWGELKGRS